MNLIPKVITLCGSSRFVEIMAVCAWILERNEKAITMGLHLLPIWYKTKCADHLAEYEGVAKEMDELHLCKIDLSNEVFVVDYEYYIGDSTKREIEYTLSKHKMVRFYTQDPIGDIVDEMVDKYLGKCKEEGK